MEHSRTVPHGILPLSYTNTQMPNLFNYRCSFMVDINKEDILKKGLLTVSNADESQIRQGLKSDHWICLHEIVGLYETPTRTVHLRSWSKCQTVMRSYINAEYKNKNSIHRQVFKYVNFMWWRAKMDTFHEWLFLYVQSIVWPSIFIPKIPYRYCLVCTELKIFNKISLNNDEISSISILRMVKSKLEWF